MKRVRELWRSFSRWLWRQIVQPNPFEELPPMDGPFELYTILPTLQGGDHNGYRLERKIAGMRSHKDCLRIADQMGIIDFYIIKREEVATKRQGEVSPQGQRVRVA